MEAKRFKFFKVMTILENVKSELKLFEFQLNIFFSKIGKLSKLRECEIIKSCAVKLAKRI